jgi:hypothetical protein
MKQLLQYTTIAMLIIGITTIGACTKEIQIDIPESSQQVVVEGTIENDMPPIVILTKSASFFGNVDLNNLGTYFLHGAQVKVTADDGQQAQLVELCLQDLNLPPDQQAVILSALGFANVDSTQTPAICVYTVPDIATYFLSGTCSFMGKERTAYALDIMSPGIQTPQDSVHVTSTTYIPTAIGLDSLAVRDHPNPDYRDSMAALYAYVTVPDTFGNFLRYKTKRNHEPYYSPLGGSVYDDRLFVGLTLGLPLERGQAPHSDFDFNTDSYFWRGDTVTVKWSNIDSKTYDFYFTLENDGGDSPFSSPVKIKTNINNGIGVWAGYATKYYTIAVPYQ